MKKLSAKITMIVFLSVLVMFMLALTVVHFTLMYNLTSQQDAMTSMIARHNGHIPAMTEFEQGAETDRRDIILFDAESQYRTRYFTVFFDDNKKIVSVDVTHIAAVDEFAACKIASEVISLNDIPAVGYYNGIYRYRLSYAEGHPIVVFLDCGTDMSSHKNTIMIVGGSLVAFSGLITLIFALFSKMIFVPFENNSLKQKQFITDASHELKTPLAIISANAEVLRYKYGENEWLSNIVGQTSRMANLINELLVLSKAEEIENPVLSPVDLSSISVSKLNEFEEIFEKKNVTVNSEITPGIIINGEDKQLEMLVSILIENASKYVSENGKVDIRLKRSGRKAVFSVENTALIPDDLDLNNLFERFYRADSSHSSKTGGHGIGLSIAKKITDRHKGTVSAARTDDGIRFTAELRIKKNPERKQSSLK